jgi:hypothetical protein
MSEIEVFRVTPVGVGVTRLGGSSWLASKFREAKPGVGVTPLAGSLGVGVTALSGGSEFVTPSLLRQSPAKAVTPTPANAKSKFFVSPQSPAKVGVTRLGGSSWLASKFREAKPGVGVTPSGGPSQVGVTALSGGSEIGTPSLLRRGPAKAVTPTPANAKSKFFVSPQSPAVTPTPANVSPTFFDSPQSPAEAVTPTPPAIPPDFRRNA